MKAKYFLILLFTGLLACTQKNQLSIIKNGKSDYEIFIPENADGTVEKAAHELQVYLEKISTVKLPVSKEGNSNSNKKKILIGFDDKLVYSPQTILFKNEGENLVITGGNPKSVLNAVYEFLEIQAGCRWYSPSVEKVPLAKNLFVKVPLEYTYSPEITTRTVHSRLFYNNPGFADKLHVTHDAFPGYVPTARVHTFQRFMPEKIFFKTHPEYFALRDGKRIPTQLCLTNPDVLRIVTDSVKAYFGRYPDAKVISVSQNDNTQYCQCDACQKIDKEEGSPSGTMIRFVNAVAAKFPDKTISTLAYQYTRKPPKTKPAENVLITLCSIECDRSAPIEEKCTAFAEDLMGWKELTENIRIWDYTTQFTNFLAPFPNIETLQPNIQFFRNNHAKWIFEQHSNQPSELFELRSYLTAKLLWNPEIDVDKTITDFTNGYYGEAGIFVKKYIDTIHEEIKKDPGFFLFLYGDPAQAFNSFLSAANLKKYDAFFNDAEKAADNPDILQRVRTARISTDYAILEMSKSGKSPDFQLLNEKGVAPEIKLRLTRFKESCKNANITLMNEMAYTVNEYFGLFDATLKRAALPNLAKGKEVTLLTQPKKYAEENPQALTDGAFGGSNFYANWLGFEGNNLSAVIDLGSEIEIKTISTAFLQVTNHIVFFPEKVSCFYSDDNKSFKKIKTIINPKPLTKTSKRNDIEYFNFSFAPIKTRYVKVVAQNIGYAPVWHNAAGLPAWIFVDEVIVN